MCFFLFRLSSKKLNGVCVFFLVCRLFSELYMFTLFAESFRLGCRTGSFPFFVFLQPGPKKHNKQSNNMYTSLGIALA